MYEVDKRRRSEVGVAGGYTSCHSTDRSVDILLYRSYLRCEFCHKQTVWLIRIHVGDMSVDFFADNMSEAVDTESHLDIHKVHGIVGRIHHQYAVTVDIYSPFVFSAVVVSHEYNIEPRHPLSHLE